MLSGCVAQNELHPVSSENVCLQYAGHVTELSYYILTSFYNYGAVTRPDIYHHLYKYINKDSNEYIKYI